MVNLKASILPATAFFAVATTVIAETLCTATIRVSEPRSTGSVYDCTGATVYACSIMQEPDIRREYGCVSTYNSDFVIVVDCNSESSAKELVTVYGNKGANCDKI
ncbi:hypothetical protein EJ02DRAFT_456044 [Clathrospora elynae]|uniref:Uncharacterized protein n=1 Tax=Clathrospora elynae TaxID=706981 RepID=A0A6A5STK8_9PLEO|nr:hypothetical protein EJ02DRAFT_456044 [Clathrospora elynae]